MIGSRANPSESAKASDPKIAAHRFAAIAGALTAILIAICLLIWPSLAEPLSRFSFDRPILFAPQPAIEDVVIIVLDEAAHRALNQRPDKLWDRGLHATLLDKLHKDGARLAVFDVFFSDPSEADQRFASAITNFGNVVVAADRVPLDKRNAIGFRTFPPVGIILDAVKTNWGIVPMNPGTDDVVREHPAEIDLVQGVRSERETPTLAWVAAAVEGAPVTRNPEQRFIRKWIRFYGPSGSILSVSYHDALNREPGFFKDKVVFIGGSPTIKTPAAASDVFQTPYNSSGLSGVKTSGVEIEATIFLNLLRNDWLTRASFGAHLCAIILAGAFCAFLFCTMRPLPALIPAIALALAFAAAAIYLTWTERIWMDWATIAGAEIPFAWCAFAVVYFHRMQRLAEAGASSLSVPVAQPRLEPIASVKGLSVTKTDASTEGTFTLRDYDLLRLIGDGSYGEVYLARTLTGAFRAIKVIYRKRFPERKPFDREFEGVKNFEPISRQHPGWVSILHVGHETTTECFYYVMEPADDMVRGQAIDPPYYTPMTLSRVLHDRGFLPLSDTLALGISLCEALGALHKRQLLHRDVKPSNIIFVNGQPKLADIGLVSVIGKATTYVGTAEFIPPEGHTAAIADIYSLGKVLYQAATGYEVNAYPKMPGDESRADSRELNDFLKIIRHACAELDSDRFQSADELKEALQQFQDLLLQRRRQRSAMVQPPTTGI